MERWRATGDYIGVLLIANSGFITPKARGTSFSMLAVSTNPYAAHCIVKPNEQCPFVSQAILRNHDGHTEARRERLGERRTKRIYHAEGIERSIAINVSINNSGKNIGGSSTLL